LHGNFGNQEITLSKPIWVYGALRDQGDASCSTLLNRDWILQGPILITIENYCDLDTSSESKYNSGEGSAAMSDCDEDEPSQDLEPEPSEDYNEKYRNTLWNPDAQIKSQLGDAQLAQLHAEIKARAEIPDRIYPKLFRSWHFRLFDVCILPEYIQHPIYYFELFWGPKVWNTLTENTNAYMQFKEARHKERKEGRKSTMVESCDFI
jgi:hypothetical protein